MDLELLETLIDGGYVNVQKHPYEELYIYNYTSSTQFEAMWNEVTLQCRGLILNQHRHIVARPLPKFFNLEETAHVQLPKNETFQVFEKMDGSLGILYFANGQPYIATRGSFSSEQAIKATEILHQKYASVLPHLNPEWTYLFEIIYPSNRIVVDYGDMEDLVLLAIVETASGKDLPLMDIGFPVVKTYDGITDFSALKALEQENKEGFVIRFENGYRVKVKFEEYKRLHYILTNVSNQSIWQHLMLGEPLDEILHLVPDEFYGWIKKTEQQLKADFRAIEEQCRKDFKTFETRKETADYFKTCPYPSILFSMLDGKDYAPAIWRIIKPEYQRAFRGV